MSDHNHKDYATQTNIICQACGGNWEACAYCDERWHNCPKKVPEIPSGYRIVPEFPDYIVNRNATVKYLKTLRYCMLMRVSKQGGAMISLLRDGKKHTRAAQDLRDSAFPPEENSE